MNVLVLIPAYNEAVNLPSVVFELVRRHPAFTVLVVDDASNDLTPELLPLLPVEHRRLSRRQGVGGAMRAGLRSALQQPCDVVVRMDADGQHRPDQIDRLLRPLLEERADAVVGSRYQQFSGYHTPLVRRLAQKGLAAALSRITGQRFTDVTSGFWAFGARAMRLLAEHHPLGYGEAELALCMHSQGLAVAEVPVQMRERSAGQTSFTLPRMVDSAFNLLAAIVRHQGPLP